MCLEIINTPFRGKFFLSVNTSQSNSGCSEASDHLSRAEKSPCDFFRRKIKLRKKIFRKFVDKKGRIIIFLGHESIRFPRFSRKGGEGEDNPVDVYLHYSTFARGGFYHALTGYFDSDTVAMKARSLIKAISLFSFFFLTNFEISKKLKRN